MQTTLRALAAAQHGALSWAQAQRAGVSPGELSRYVTRGEVVRVRRGAFVLGDTWRAADPDRRYALTTRAVLLSRPGDAASHQATFALSGLPLWGVDLTRVYVQGTATRRRSPSGLRLHPWDISARRELVAGARTLTIAEARRWWPRRGPSTAPSSRSMLRCGSDCARWPRSPRWSPVMKRAAGSASAGRGAYWTSSTHWPSRRGKADYGCSWSPWASPCAARYSFTPRTADLSDGWTSWSTIG
ncbi:MAG: type IV toxin-antitoxin system AbiEi family antitoxin domain-containing protein [Actinomycetales bacterium]|nr:type IV toxin-antitoxin system AbiEi family antitoxin domain-containing protein [Actinomycetales bacterium]